MERCYVEEVQELKETVGGLAKGMNWVNERLTKEMHGVKEMMMKMQETLGQLVEKQRLVDESQAQFNRSPNTEETAETNGNTVGEVGRFRKLELLIFDGDDPLGWFFRVERYFSVNAVSEN